MKNSCLNWDKKSWLSSNEYFNDLNKLLITKLKINHLSKILDIGCGRGYLLNNLSEKINFKTTLNGVEPIKHKKNYNEKIKIYNLSIQDFFKKNDDKYNYILIKQVLHLIPIEQRELLYIELKKKIFSNGKIVIMQMNEKFQLPCFPEMKKTLIKSLSQHQIIENELKNIFIKIEKEEFSFKVNISKKEYIDMIKDKFISVLSHLSKEDIKKGVQYIQNHYPANISFIDKLQLYIIN